MKSEVLLLVLVGDLSGSHVQTVEMTLKINVPESVNQAQTFFDFDDRLQKGQNTHACARLARTRKANGACPRSLLLRVYCLSTK